jgi:signal transduction histidine kinase
LRATRTDIQECRYGISYVRLDENRLIVGIVTSGLPSSSRKAKAQARGHPELGVPAGSVHHAVERAVALGPGVVKDFEMSKQEVLRGLRDSPEMFAAVAEQLKAEFQENLSQSHDFVQLAKLVKGYAESLLQEKYPNLSNEDAAEKLPVEGSIYFSTELMLLKLDALVFLHEINLVHGGEKRFQIHPLVLKYCRIYRWQAEQKDLNLQLSGSSYGSCRYNPQAIGAIIQGLLDNLVKYAPAGSKATIVFQEGPEIIRVEFTSLGPRIEDDELRQIFLPGFRARAARGAASSGLGLGLATAKQVSDALNLRLSVEQSPEEDTKYRARYPTTFSIDLARV